MRQVKTLVVVKNVKEYVKGYQGFNTSGKVAEVLTQRVKDLLDKAIQNAESEGRKTVMDMDFKETAA